jgi:hypothetical protein
MANEGNLRDVNVSPVVFDARATTKQDGLGWQPEDIAIWINDAMVRSKNAGCPLLNKDQETIPPVVKGSGKYSVSKRFALEHTPEEVFRIGIAITNDGHLWGHEIVCTHETAPNANTKEVSKQQAKDESPNQLRGWYLQQFGVCFGKCDERLNYLCELKRFNAVKSHEDKTKRQTS